MTEKQNKSNLVKTPPLSKLHKEKNGYKQKIFYLPKILHFTK